MITKLEAAPEGSRGFERVALRYFHREVGPGRVQRIDGIECFSPLPDYWFWRYRLNRMVKNGLLVRRSVGSFWPSCDGMPAYGLKAKDASHERKPHQIIGDEASFNGEDK